MFADKGIEFSCKKGQHGHINQDNFFVVLDGDTKIYGLYDGHGAKGHLISSFAMGTMVDFIKNSKCFKNLHNSEMNGGEPLSDAEMTKAIRLCFKYTQDRVREQYYDYLVNEKKKEMVKSKMEAAKRKAEEYERNQTQKVKRDRSIESQKKLDANMNRLNTKYNTGNHQHDEQAKKEDKKSKALSSVNDIGLEDDNQANKAEQMVDVDPLSEEFAKEMALIEDDEIEINQEDLNFIDNISWDTASLEDDEDVKDTKSQKSLDSDGNPKDFFNIAK